METYECVICGNFTETEKEGFNEARDFSECPPCFDRSLEDKN